MESFKRVWFSCVKNAFPEIEINCKYKNRDSDVYFSSGQHSQAIEDESLDEHNEPILCANV
jgi:hypothetical protein